MLQLLKLSVSYVLSLFIFYWLQFSLIFLCFSHLVKDGILDASQEMLTLGICNVAGSFFSAMPTCGAFTRSAVSQASGVRTPMAGIYTGKLYL